VAVFCWGLPAVKATLEGRLPFLSKSIVAPELEVPGLDGRIAKVPPATREPFEIVRAIYRLNWLSAAGTGILVAALAAVPWLGISWRRAAVIWWENLRRLSLSLLTIACPCALALAAPLVITVAIGRAAKEKIWIRDGNSLERLAKPGLMCLDKTGTLTFGDLRVIDWSGPKELLMSIARIELESEHPVARALVDYGRSEFGVEEFERRIDSVRVSQVRQEAGRGIYGRVDGKLIYIGRSETPIAPSDTFREVAVWVDGEVQGKFRLGDSIRPNLVSSLRQIRDRGWKLVILSGDDSPQVQQIADALSASGVDLVACHGGLSPEQKLQRLGELRREGMTTVMVGDGVNDAVALAAADVGIAVRGPCELAMKNAPIFIGERHLEAIPRLLDASRNAVRAIHRCFAASLLYNALTVSLAMTGYIHPLIAAIFMPISGITVLTMAWSARTFPQRQEKNS
jgi:Cu2+-exporting ATPase